MEAMQKRLGEAAEGGGTAKKALDKLGLSAENLLRLSPADQFMRIADAVSRLETETEQQAATALLFSRSNQALVQTLKLGSDAIRERIRETIRLRGSINSIDAKRIQDANDAIGDMKLAFSGLGDTIAIEVAPRIQAMVKEIRGFVEENREAIGELAGAVFGSIARMVRHAVELIREHGEEIRDFSKNAASRIRSFFDDLGTAIRTSITDAASSAFDEAELRGRIAALEIKKQFTESGEEFQNALTLGAGAGARYLFEGSTTPRAAAIQEQIDALRRRQELMQERRRLMGGTGGGARDGDGSPPTVMGSLRAAQRVTRSLGQQWAQVGNAMRESVRQMIHGDVVGQMMQQLGLDFNISRMMEEAAANAREASAQQQRMRGIPDPGPGRLRSVGLSGRFHGVAAQFRAGRSIEQQQLEEQKRAAKHMKNVDDRLQRMERHAKRRGGGQGGLSLGLG